MQAIKKLPLPLVGVALALATLGNALQGYAESLRIACGLLSAVLLLVFTIRIFWDGATVRKELKNVLVISTLPAYFMTHMTLSTYVAPLALQVAFLWWGAAFIAQIALVLYFAWRYLRSFRMETVFPSWFLVFVASYEVAGITSPVYGLKAPVGQPVFYVGLVCYLLILPLVLYRVFVYKRFPESAKPSLGIFMSPVNMCLVDYLAVFEQREAWLVALLYVMSLLTAVCFLLYLPRLLRLPFYPSFAGMTFPSVIWALAFKQVDASGILFTPGTLAPLVPVVDLFAAVMVFYVLGRACIFLWPSVGKRALREPQLSSLRPD